MNLRQIYTADISAFVLKQWLITRLEIFSHLDLPSAFLAVRLALHSLQACRQISLSPPLPKGRGREYQIHAPHPCGSGAITKQRSDLFPCDKIQGAVLKPHITRPVFCGCEHGGIIGHAQYRADNNVLLVRVYLKGCLHLTHAQVFYAKEYHLQRISPRINGNGWYLIHVNMNASFACNSQEIMQDFAVYTAMPEWARSLIEHLCRNTRGSCGGISYRGGERAQLR